MFIADEDVIKSVQRVFDILEWFDRARTPASSTTVARALGYPVSSTNSLLKSMSARGYLSFDSLRKDYLPTLQLCRQGAWMDAGCYGRGRLRALVQELQAMTGEIVTLSCQNDLQMVFLDVAEPPRDEVVPASAGGMAPLFRSAIGFAALSCRTDLEVGQLITRYNRRTYRTSAKADPELVLSHVRRVRATGHGVGYGLFVEDTGAVAWALPATGPAPAVVIAVAGPNARLRRDETAIVEAGRIAISRFRTMTH